MQERDDPHVLMSRTNADEKGTRRRLPRRKRTAELKGTQIGERYKPANASKTNAERGQANALQAVDR